MSDKFLLVFNDESTPPMQVIKQGFNILLSYSEFFNGRQLFNFCFNGIELTDLVQGNVRFANLGVLHLLARLGFAFFSVGEFTANVIEAARPS